MAAKTLAPGYILVDGYPLVDDYVHLRTASGLSPKNAEQATIAIKGSWYGCYIAEEASPSRAVAMGRIIGDGGWYFLIADMATLPEHQRRGLGDVIIKKLLARIKSHSAKGTAYVSLGADEPGRRLYLKNGFKESAPATLGMAIEMKITGDDQ
jgi:GNAT superfamily N-acetyltransferase